MSQAPSMPVFTDALIGDTLHLSTEEFGAYCLLLFSTWRNNGRALADDDISLARICRVTETRWRRSLRVKLVGFFDISDGHWHQGRLEREWRYVQERAEVSRHNGRRGGRPPKNPEPPRPGNGKNPPGNPEETHQVTAEETQRGTQTEPTQPQAQTHYLESEEIEGFPRAGARAGLTVLSAAERKARWQSRMLQEAQATMTPKRFGELVVALMEDPPPPWAKDELERLNRQIERRRVNGRAA
jgi:uncharacterized protein YdaU (DUF1376 family)